ncbi:MAG: EamA/RhaT family transporter [Gammaproteobacteria bacterium]|nr:MAG: EamA/RhaT family transporter [Gammaproteobacteria bacterium]
MLSNKLDSQVSLLDRLGDRYPYVLLLITCLCFSGNIVVGRGLHELVPPFALTFWRWLLVALILLPVCWPTLRRERRLIGEHRWLLLGLGFGSVTCYNGFFYLGLNYSTAINGAMVTSIMPLLIAFMAWLVFAQVPGRLQGMGILLSFVGILVVIAKGDLAVLMQFQFGRGDLWILVATFAWACYSIALRFVPPQLGGLTLVAITSVSGVVTLLPVFLWELSTGAVPVLNANSYGGIVFLALFPGVIAYLTFARGVASVGPVRAGVFLNSTPLFAIAAAVLFLDERIYEYHLIGGAIIAAGLFLVSRQRQTPSSD